MLNEAIKYFQTGNLAKAEEIANQVLATTPEDPDALHILAAVLMQGQQLKEAEEALKKAIKIREGDPNYHNTLAFIMRAQKKYKDAVRASEKALSIVPNNPDFLNNIGVTYMESGDRDRAILYYNKALEAKPDFVEALMNLGVAYIASFEFEKAIEIIKHAIKLRPNYAEAYHNLATAYKNSMKYEPAIAAAKQAILLRPDLLNAWINICEAYYFYSDHEAAINSYDEAIKKFPDAQGLKVQRAILMPHMAESNEDIDELRQKFLNNLDKLIEQGLRLDNPEKEHITMPFYQGYHGRNNMVLMEKLYEFFKKASPSLCYTAKHCTNKTNIKKHSIKVGFVSKYFCDHTVNTFYKQIILGLVENKRFEVILFAAANKHDHETKMLAEKCRLITLEDSLPKAREQIAKEECDMIIYLEIGMNIFTYLLAFARLAPIQCVMAGGHPVPSAIETIDYALSSKLCEPPNGQEHYKEKLILFDYIPCTFPRQQLPSVEKTRAELGLPEGRLYMCPVLLFRIHPDMDYIFAEILKRDAEAKIILFENESKNKWKEILEERFKKTIPQDVKGRIIFIPFAKGDDFFHAIKAADILIDPFHFSLGATVLKALSAGLPLVTLPGEFMRGRSAFCFYQRMGILDAVAKDRDDYIELAIKFANDMNFKKSISGKIKEKSPMLFDDLSVIPEVARRLQDIYEQESAS